jgi:hypothetical protein
MGTVETRVGDLATDVGAKIKTLQLARDLPSYVDPLVLQNQCDPMNSIYNLKRSNSRRIQQSLIKARSGQIGEWMIAGASGEAGSTNGVSLTYDRINAWPIVMGDELVRKGVAKGGTGQIRVMDNTVSDARVIASTGVWTPTKIYTSINAAGSLTWQLNEPGDRVTVKYYDNGIAGSFSVSIDGGGATTVNHSGAAGWKKATINATVKVGSTVLVTRVSGTTTLFSVGSWFSTGGLIVHNLAQSGSKISGAGDSSWIDNSAFNRLGSVAADPCYSLADPDVVFAFLGANDGPVATTPLDTIMADLTTFRNRYPNSDFVLGGTSALNTTVITDANWQAYLKRLWELGDALDCPVVDFYLRLGNYAEVVAKVYSTDGQGHLLSQVYNALGRGMAEAFAGYMGNAVTPTVRTVPTGTTGFEAMPNGTLWIEYTP